ncbi:hypothetical protein BP5796_03140 [Coleophoma crateriformis]|uniref:DUF1993 domain-containing protein n=1 Tax=Coleophoma crateriformis TaxID=565419 RepID=A0A3D8SME1_9HELO|nr:hypothetical protein BP5796_03140 [Coleophoma crateriformis]
MPVSLYDVTIPVFIQQLKTLAHLLSAGSAHVTSEETLLNTRLIEDMQPLSYQIQRVSDTAKGLVTRVGKKENVVWEDNEQTMAQLHERIAKTIAYLEKVEPTAFDGTEEEEVVVQFKTAKRTFTGTSYVNTFAIPNFYFHLCMTYALLRKEGVPIGKADYLLGPNKPKA